MIPAQYGRELVHGFEELRQHVRRRKLLQHRLRRDLPRSPTAVPAGVDDRLGDEHDDEHDGEHDDEHDDDLGQVRHQALRSVYVSHSTRR